MKNYLNKDEVVLIHKNLIDEFGGSHGILDSAGLESAVARPKSGYYNNIIEEAAALMESLAINHPFIDGNKRIAFFATDIFLRINGYVIQCDNQAAFDFLMGLLKSNTFKYDNILPWLEEKIEEL